MEFRSLLVDFCNPMTAQEFNIHTWVKSAHQNALGALKVGKYFIELDREDSIKDRAKRKRKQRMTKVSRRANRK